MTPPNRAGNCVNGYCEIPGRTFLMGSPKGVGEEEEHPQRRVTMPTRWLRRTEVTLDEMREFFRQSGADLSVVLSGCASLGQDRVVVKRDVGESEDVLLERARRIGEAGGCSVDNLKVERQGIEMNEPTGCGRENRHGGDHPVVCVNHEDAEAFCASEGGTLPSEALIENAMRGISGTEEFGNPIETAAIDRGLAGARSVCGPNSEREGPFGVCDLSGNVFERTSTRYVPNYYRTMPRRNPNAHIVTGRETIIVRGGSFVHGREKARAAARGYDGASLRISDVGFRCARLSPPPDSKK